MKTKPHEQLHKNGSLWARGQTLDDESHGYWEWYRKDGVIMRSGHFCQGAQVGDWTTYDKTGKVYKVTRMKTPDPEAKAAAKKTPAKKKPAVEPSLDAFLAALDHPLKADIEAVRKTVLGADKAIGEGVKWNSLSFKTTEWFATVNLRSTDSVQVVMHLGAKVGKEAAPDEIPDPKRLLKWLGKDRALVTLGKDAALKGNQAAFKAIVKAWIAFV